MIGSSRAVLLHRVCLFLETKRTSALIIAATELKKLVLGLFVGHLRLGRGSLSNALGAQQKKGHYV
jgi:hypothetical protein